jgi:hypothetical protein
MNLKTERARQGGSPSLAPTPNQSNIKKELTAMVSINSKLSKVVSNTSTATQPSPWITRKEDSVFGYEMSIAEDPSCHTFIKPNPLFVWLNANKLNTALFDVLAKLCPLYPVVSNRGHTSIWLSPPPSGSGNTVGIIIGRDKSNQLRIIGTNFMNCPASSINSPSECVFEAFDALGDSALAIYRLIENEISARMTSNELKISEQIEEEAYKYRTMSIYLLVIDGENSYFAIDTALVLGDHPSDMSFEYAGELK